MFFSANILLVCEIKKEIRKRLAIAPDTFSDQFLSNSIYL